MTGSDRSLRTLLAQAADWASEQAWNARPGGEHEPEEPLRAALFSSDQMVAHGKSLAGRHRLAKTQRPDRLLARLACGPAGDQADGQQYLAGLAFGVE